jgi:hypothetical protein
MVTPARAVAHSSMPGRASFARALGYLHLAMAATTYAMLTGIRYGASAIKERHRGNLADMKGKIRQAARRVARQSARFC